MKNGGWIFISHSHQDIDKVRRIRNHLERLGLEPLMFYLKCLSDEDEIEGLIKREINERDWFIYVDSPNARSSKWVQTEREYIETLTGKKVFTIDLNSDIDSQLMKIEHIARQMKVFISAHLGDIALQNRIKEKLVKKDMLVLTPMDVISEKENFVQHTVDAINDVTRDGFVLLLLTEKSQKSQHVIDEILYTRKISGKIIPIIVGDVSLSPEMLYLIGDQVFVKLSKDPTDEELDVIVNRVMEQVSYSTDFKDTYGYRSAKSIHLPEISRIDSETFFDCENLECVYIPDSVIYISADAFEEYPDILVKCTKDSYAEQYCKRHKIKYELIKN